MFEALIAAAGIGFLLGLRYRVPAAVAASAAAVVAGALVAYLKGASLWAILLLPVGAVVALQCGYLGGLLVAFGVAHNRQRRRHGSATERSPTFEECGDHYAAPSAWLSRWPPPARADISRARGWGAKARARWKRLRRVVA
jgi:hypothetical protein